MSQGDHAQSDDFRPRRRRRWWQIVLRLAGVVGALVAGLYATLPWWLPETYVGERLAAALTDQLGLPVRIGRVSLSWRDGVGIDHLSVGAKEPFEGEMIVLGKLGCEFSPLRMLLSKPVRWAEVSDASLRVVINEQHEVNLAVLGQLEVGYPPENLIIRSAEVTIRVPGNERLLRLNVADLQYRSGRLRGVGRITMSAVLDQDGRDAPVTLMASLADQVARSVAPAATCSFHFAGVDIAQLNLPLLLGLPLERLAGRGSGSLDCRVRRSGEIGEFSFALRVRDLDAQPMQGPKLPVIERAEVRLSAAADPVTNSGEIRSFRLRLPGIDLAGKGRMHADVLRGGWEGLHALEVVGAVNPTTIVTLLTGREPVGLALDGEVKVQLAMKGDRHRLTSEVMLDATGAGLRAGERLIKPPGRTLAAELTGSLEKRTWRLSAERAELRIGGNRFVGGGAIQNVRRLLSEGRPPAEAVMANLDQLDSRGSWEIVELDSLRDVLGGSMPEPARLEGRIVGEWSLDRDGLIELDNVRLPADTSLRVGRWFDKPAGRPARLEVSGVLDRKARSLRKLRLSADVGRAGVTIDRGRLAVLAPGGPAGESPRFEAEADVSLRDAAGLLACVPAAEQWAERFGGSLRGNFRAVVCPTFGRLHVEADATQLACELPPAFTKGAGQPVRIDADFQVHRGLPPAERNRLEARVDLGSARLDGALVFAAGGGGRIRCRADLSVTDAAWLLQRVPAAAGLLESCGIRGSTTVGLRAELGDGSLAGEIAWDADDLEIVLPGAGCAKGRGTPLRLRLAGRIRDGLAVIHAFSADLGKSSIWLDGKLALSVADRAPPPGAYWPPPGVAGVDLFLRGRFVADSAARSLLPAVGALARRCGAEGAVRVEADIRGGAEGVEVSGRFDAADLALAYSGGRLRKRAGAAAGGRFAFDLPADLTKLSVGDLFLDAGAFQLRADASLPLLGAGPVTGHVAVSVRDLGRLEAFVPELAEYAAGGSAFLEGEYRRAGGRGELLYLTLTGRDARAAYRGKACRLNGSAALEGVTWSGGKLGLAGLRTDSLELGFGDSRAFLAADLRHPLDAPAGWAELLAEKLDLREIQQLDESAMAPPPAEPLSAEQIESCGRAADRLIRPAIERLVNADVRCRLDAERVVFFDPIIQALYDVRDLAAKVGVSEKKLQAELRYGLNGGQIEQTFELDLARGPLVAETEARYRDILAGENMQAQLAREFPGNTFAGRFSRNERVSYSLREMVMQMLDGRYRPVRVGRATTITTDGVICGRAAPRFITRFLPGLNLATYRYRRMTGFAEYMPDGAAVNDMIFKGDRWDIYISGSTDAEQIARYTVGVILPRLLESPRSNSRLRQGRVPILKFKARIHRGRFQDERVSYPLPPETAYIMFVRNNIVYRLLAGGREQRTAEVVRSEPTTSPAPAR